MRVNTLGYLHENITALRLEENCRLRGRKEIFHRIWGYDEDKGYEFVLDWGIDLEQVREYYKQMQKRLQQDSSLIWRCEYSRLDKEKRRERKDHELSYVNGQAYKGSGRKVYAGTGTKSRSKVYAGR